MVDSDRGQCNRCGVDVTAAFARIFGPAGDERYCPNCLPLEDHEDDSDDGSPSRIRASEIRG